MFTGGSPDRLGEPPVRTYNKPYHTLAFALLVGTVGAGLGFGLGSTAEGGSATLPLAVFGFGIGTLAVLAHLLADALTPAGVPLLWPLSSREFSVSLTRADDTLANYALLGLGVGVVAAAALLAVRVA